MQASILLGEVNARFNATNYKRGGSALQLETVRRIGLAKEYIHRHYQEEVAIQQLCRIAYMSPTHFIKRFKEVTGMTPYQYLMHVRLEKAKYLLLHTEYSVEDITVCIGFESASSFIRLFRARTAVTPRTFKKMGKWRLGNNALCSGC